MLNPDRNRAELMRQAVWLRRMQRVRPAILVEPMNRMLRQRRLFQAEGLRLFIDPTTHLGQSILNSGTYEPETIQIFREHVRPGATVLDIGANEGFFSSMAAQLAGPSGLVIAVEPQSRLLDVIEINLALNAVAKTKIVHGAIAERDGDKLQLALFPGNNTGASSLVRRYRWSNKTEPVSTITPAAILRDSGRERFDFVKIDVEGFEPEVIRSLHPLLSQGRIGTLLLDYHAAILQERGIDPRNTHDLILSTGYRGSGDVRGGYVIYQQATSSSGA